MRRKKIEFSFTLIELIIVVVIIGVLATFAVPAFRGQVLKAKVAKAKHAISLINGAEQAYYSEFGSYQGDLNQLFTTTGIDLYDTLVDTDWTYAYAVNNTSATITAQKKAVPCQNNNITFDMQTGIFSLDPCLQ